MKFWESEVSTDVSQYPAITSPQLVCKRQQFINLFENSSFLGKRLLEPNLQKEQLCARTFPSKFIVSTFLNPSLGLVLNAILKLRLKFVRFIMHMNGNLHCLWLVPHIQTAPEKRTYCTCNCTAEHVYARDISASCN